MRLSLFTLLISSLLITLSGCASNTDAPATSDAKKASRTAVSLIAIGDAGYVSDKPGKSSLVRVSVAAKQYCAEHGCDFGLMAGDNIYPMGADGNPDGIEDAKRFETIFVKPYGDFQKYTNDDFRLYAALGNHDWYNSRAGAVAQLEFLKSTPPFFMDDFFYRVKPVAGNGDVELFVIDTEMLLAPMQLERVKINAQGQPVSANRTGAGGTPNALPNSEREKQQLDWLSKALKSSTAKWKLVLAHHPLWESKGTKFKQAEALRGMLLPILCGQVDAYFAGHQHTLEVHEDSCASEQTGKPLRHIISGAASKARSIDESFRQWQSANHSQLKNHWAMGDVAGFMHVTIDGDELDVRAISVNKKGGVKEQYRHRFNRQ